MLQQNIADLMHEMELNYPGVCTMLVVEKKGVQSMPNLLSLMSSHIAADEGDFYIEEIILKAGYSWKKISTDFSFDVSFEEEEKVTMQGKHFTCKTALKIPNDSFSRGKIQRAYDGVEFIQLIKESTGAWRVVGTMERGCVYYSKLSTGTRIKGPNKHECGFVWESGERCFYTKSLALEGEWFEMRFDLSAYLVEKIIVKESMYVTWGDGTSGMYTCNTGSNNTIEKTYSGVGFKTARFYHFNKSILLSANGGSPYNRNIASISGKLPKALVYLYANGNVISSLPPFENIPSGVLVMELAGNAITTTSLMANYMATLVQNGLSGGVFDINTQSPALTPNAGMLSSKTVLESRGWIVTF